MSDLQVVGAMCAAGRQRDTVVEVKLFYAEMEHFAAYWADTIEVGPDLWPVDFADCRFLDSCSALTLHFSGYVPPVFRGSELIHGSFDAFRILLTPLSLIELVGFSDYFPVFFPKSSTLFQFSFVVLIVASQLG